MTNTIYPNEASPKADENTNCSNGLSKSVLNKEKSLIPKAVAINRINKDIDISITV
tara:strand:- start:214 stop:381 length:168 start_codon:yes stop_codon:yes gene_type:complete